jgi:hypothetical protein
MRIRTTLARAGLLGLVLATGACMQDETGGSYSSASRWAARRLVLPAGTAIQVRLASWLHSQISSPGDSWTGEIVSPVLVDGQRILPAGTWVHGIVVDSRRPRSREGAMLDLEVRSVTIDGKDIRLDASADQVLDEGITVAVSDEHSSPLVLGPGTAMTFTVEESASMGVAR